MSNDLSVRRISIQERARVASKTAIGAWLAEPYPNQADERAATEVESALRGLLLDLQWEIEGLKATVLQSADEGCDCPSCAHDFAACGAYCEVLALIAGLLEAGQ